MSIHHDMRIRIIQHNLIYFEKHHCLIHVMHYIRLTFTFQERYNQILTKVQAMKPGSDRIVSWSLHHIVKLGGRPDNSIRHREAWIQLDIGLSLSYEARIRPDNSLIPSNPWSPNYDRITAQQVTVKPGLRPDSNTKTPWSLDSTR